MQFKWTLPLVAAAAFLLVFAVGADSALAVPLDSGPTASRDIGGNFGDWIRDNFVEIILATAGVIAAAAVFKRDAAMALLMVVVTAVVLGFFMEPNPYLALSEEFFKIFKSGTIGV